ncbi:hypothetical protein ACNAN0_04240 [Agrilactobacillus fermenti]|uniref:hypothetical protein n=1 Tax=Agrilactobacillus fermenti TaxID=2586909 RepID=UPI001E34A954|nr:hypothetical protein [Agrilactobacillus fermenti]MCD2256309.1 hypothetical protein [Agrilactobacillus fermenti]
MKWKQPGYIFVVVIFLLSLIGFICIQCLNTYHQQMIMLRQFQHHQEAVIVFDLTRPIYQDQHVSKIETSLGNAIFTKKGSFVYCEVQLKNTKSRERFKYIDTANK